MTVSTASYTPADGTTNSRIVRVSGTAAEVLQELINQHVKVVNIIVLKDDATFAVYRVN